MKVFLFIFCIAIIAISCKKGTIDPKSASNSALFAKWELRIQRGGVVPDKNYAPGNGNIVQFKADSTYVFYTNSNITKQGTFHIGEIVQGPEKLDYIYYDHTTNGDVIELKNGNLTLGTSAADGLSYIYAKL